MILVKRLHVVTPERFSPRWDSHFGLVLQPDVGLIHTDDGGVRLQIASAPEVAHHLTERSPHAKSDARPEEIGFPADRRRLDGALNGGPPPSPHLPRLRLFELSLDPSSTTDSPMGVLKPTAVSPQATPEQTTSKPAKRKRLGVRDPRRTLNVVSIQGQGGQHPDEDRHRNPMPQECR